MDWTLWNEFVNKIAEHIILWGGAMTALFIGLKRMYKVAKNIDNLVTYTNERKETDAKIAQDLIRHMDDVKKYNAKRDVAMAALTSDVREITREVRPNGGSSMKDQLTAVTKDISNIKERLAPIEQWKKDIES